MGIDDGSGEIDSGARVVLVSLEDHKLNCAARFGFKASNNIAKYKAFLASLRLAKDVQ